MEGGGGGHYVFRIASKVLTNEIILSFDLDRTRRYRKEDGGHEKRCSVRCPSQVSIVIL